MQFENSKIDKNFPKYVAFLLKELMKRINEENILSKTSDFIYVASITTNNPEFTYNWDGIKLVNKTLRRIGIDSTQCSYRNIDNSDGSGKEITYTWKITPKKKKRILVL